MTVYLTRIIQKPMAFKRPTHLRHCQRCEIWVKPTYVGKTIASSQSTLPGVFGLYKSVACCPDCGEEDL